MAERSNPVASDDAGVINIPASSVPEVLRNAPMPGNTLHTLKRGDEEVQVTTEQLKTMAQKGWNADVVTQQSKETQKQYEEDHRLAEDLRAVISEGDVDAFRRMGLAAGVRGAELEEIVQQTFGEGEEEEDDSPAPQVSLGNGKVDFNQLPADVQRLLLRGEKSRISEIVQSELDRSDKIRYNMEQYDEKGRAAIRTLIDEKIRTRLADTNGDFGDGRFILPGVLKEVEGLLEAMNSPTRKVSPLGVGPAPGGDGIDSYPKKLPDHVPSSHSGAFEQNVLETLAFHHANAQRSR